MNDAKARLRALAARQHGAFTRKQALELGVSRHTIDSCMRDGTFVSLGRATFGIGGVVATFECEAMAAVLRAGPGAAISHFAAASLHGLLPGKPKTIAVSVPHDRRANGTKRARTLTKQDVRRVRGIPVTCPGRTLVDLAGIASDDALEEATDTALLRGLASVEGLRHYIAGRNLGSLRGVGRLQGILDDRERFGVPEGVLERKLIRLLKRFGLPQAIRQYRVGDRWLDFAYPDHKILIELDGRIDHSKKRVFEDDRKRQNALVLAGWTVLRFTWDDVTKRSAEVARSIDRALRGCTGGGT